MEVNITIIIIMYSNQKRAMILGLNFERQIVIKTKSEKQIFP